MVAMLEYQKTLDVVSGLIGGLVRTARAIKRRDPRIVRQILRKKKLTKRDIATTPSGLWLQYHFGIVPTIHDIHSAMNILSGRILEIEGLPDLKVEQAFELSDASAERSAAGCTIKLNKEPVAEYLKSNIVLMKNMIANGYQDARTLERRIKAQEAWLANPNLLEADKDAKYAAVIEIERRWYPKWESKNYFAAGVDSGKADNFCILLPPPNVTGTLHMGHGFNQTIMVS